MEEIKKKPMTVEQEPPRYSDRKDLVVEVVRYDPGVKQTSASQFVGFPSWVTNCK